MRRVTVAITLPSSYWGATNCDKIRSAMINAAVAKATELNESMLSLDAKVANNVRNRHPA